MATTPEILSSDVTMSSSNGASTSHDISYAAYADGDLLIFHETNDTDGLTLTTTIPSGPNGETAVVLRQDVNDTVADPFTSVWYYICSGSNGGGTLAVTHSNAARWVAATVLLPSGEYKAGDADDSNGINTDNGSNLQSPAWTATSGAAEGLVVMFGGVDTASIDATPTGWTDRGSADPGLVAGVISTRDAAATADESIAAATWTLSGADGWASVGYVLNAFESGVLNPASFSQSMVRF
jgi:hypothetical protein